MDFICLLRGGGRNQIPEELTLKHYGFTEADLQKAVVVPPMPIFDTVR
jgi:hypothetical protein